MLNAILTRWARSRAASSSRGPGLPHRHSTLPPSRHAARSSLPADSIWQSLLRWMPGDSDPWGGKAQPGTSDAQTLAAARAEFQACLQGLQAQVQEEDPDRSGSPPAHDNVRELQRSIRRARSLHDLWHLRTWLYTEVARSFSQHEAEQRLQRLDACFQGRAASQALNPAQLELLAMAQAQLKQRAAQQAQRHAETLARMRRPAQAASQQAAPSRAIENAGAQEHSDTCHAH